MLREIPLVTFATPKPEEVWRAYIGESLKARELNSGTIQVATGGGEWVTVNG